MDFSCGVSFVWQGTGLFAFLADAKPSGFRSPVIPGGMYGCKEPGEMEGGDVKWQLCQSAVTTDIQDLKCTGEEKQQAATNSTTWTTTD